MLALIAVAVITLANLRGLKQSGGLFAVPTYTYVALMTLMVGYGLFRTYFGHLHAVPFDPKAFVWARQAGGGTLGLFLLLKGFSSGAVALTGVEAISNGVPAGAGGAGNRSAVPAPAVGHRRRPDPGRQHRLRRVPPSELHRGPRRVLAPPAGPAGRPPGVLQWDHCPGRRSRRPPPCFRGETDALVPLYAVGVFTAFTLSQTGMVRHHQRNREPGWHWRLAVNAVGATATAIVLVIIGVSKFTAGAWIPIVLVPVIVTGFSLIRRNYDHLERAMAVAPDHALPNP